MNRLLFSSALAFTALLSTLVVSTQAQAAFYGDFSSPTGSVTFTNVADVNGLFGTPVVSGNSLDFSPNMFETDCASSITCPPTPSVATDTLTFQVDADNGVYLPRIILTESGDTTINDFMVATGFAATTVVANVFVDILELDGVAIVGLSANRAMNFTSGGTFDTATEGNGSHIWDGLLALDLEQIINDAGLSGHATLVEISLENTLTAFAQDGAVAFIEKKDIDGLAIKAIPEPGTVLLMGLGLIGLSMASRRVTPTA